MHSLSLSYLEISVAIFNDIHDFSLYCCGNEIAAVVLGLLKSVHYFLRVFLLKCSWWYLMFVFRGVTSSCLLCLAHFFLSLWLHTFFLNVFPLQCPLFLSLLCDLLLVNFVVFSQVLLSLLILLFPCKPCNLVSVFPGVHLSLIACFAAFSFHTLVTLSPFSYIQFHDQQFISGASFSILSF